jgi:hypothetical protein
MGWDVSFFRRTGDADPSDYGAWLPLGEFDALVARLTPHLGAPSPRVPGYWIVHRDGCELRVSIGDHEEPITSVGAGVYGPGNPFPTLRTLAEALGCEVLDLVNWELVDLPTGRSDGLDLQRATETLFAAIQRR